jgi:hypothetical protein
MSTGRTRPHRVRRGLTDVTVEDDDLIVRVRNHGVGGLEAARPWPPNAPCSTRTTKSTIICLATPAKLTRCRATLPTNATSNPTATSIRAGECSVLAA